MEWLTISQYDSRFQKLQDRLKDPNEIRFSNFKEVFSYFVNQEAPADPGEKRIGIFLDVANLYTDLHDLEVDYRRLFTVLYGMEGKKQIKDRFAVFFQPVYESAMKTEAFKKRQNVLAAKLEEQGFEIILAGNEKAKAKQMVGGEAHDADDNKLIQRMEERLGRLTEILLFTGDKDFYEILQTYKTAGRRVKVISTHPDSTSNRIREGFDHSYITDYWDCIHF
ncbi:NYN domain-containing protein [Bacillus marinisedimentorum]|uniref:NYN domain-containing protein n=1 Tax=Bacillus marinisedimentorum TaxID=1821260 RepID=UPI0007E2188A|nr:NYN domain-containing protein [Bacillus marinisedimentorum]